MERMEVQLGFEKVEVSRAIKVSDLVSVRLVARDYEVIRFLIQMKFSSIEEIHQKFFKVSSEGIESSSLRWARERLAVLCGLGLVSSENVAGSNKRYFVATAKGYHLISRALLLDGFAKPTGRIDIRTFEHDLAVLRMRLELESESSVTHWISDRELKVASEKFDALRGDYAPDAIYQTPSGEQVALEVEIARKAKIRYQKKIQHYVDTYRDRESSAFKLSKVHVVCLRKSVFEIWQEKTEIFGSIFQVQFKDVLDLAKRGAA
jgi:hypothetical protein